MSAVELYNVRKSYGSVEVIGGVDLSVAEGEFVAFVGPSGSGKSTLLRMIAGLEGVSGGRIVIGGRDVTFLEPSERGIAMVFQSYALYPHMSVRDNIAFNLRLARTPRAAIEARLAEAARILRIEDLLDRSPAQLSGGQRQRVAIGRAIVRKPEVFLFDEPLSNLDAGLRVQMRLEIERLHRSLGATMIYVTHDQVEAMTLADRVVALERGAIRQVATPQEMYARPRDLFVAGFIGSPRMNIVAATVTATGASGAELAPAAQPGARVVVPFGGLEPGARVSIGIRPEDLSLGGAAPGSLALAAHVVAVERHGNIAFAHADYGAEESATLQLANDTPVRAGQDVMLLADPARLHVFGADGLALRRANPACLAHEPTAMEERTNEDP